MKLHWLLPEILRKQARHRQVSTTNHGVHNVSDDAKGCEQPSGRPGPSRIRSFQSHSQWELCLAVSQDKL